MSDKILLVGNNALTAGIAQHLQALGCEWVLATPVHKADLSPAVKHLAGSHDRFKIMPQTRVLDCKGQLGGFSAHLDTGQERRSIEISRVIIAEDPDHRVDGSRHGLRSSESIISLSDIEKAIRSETDFKTKMGQARTFVFLMNLASETTAVNTRRAMQAAQYCQEAGKQVYLLTGNLKVGGQGLEQAYREARDAGIVFVKFSHTRPRIQTRDSDRVVITFDDEVAGRPFRLTPDIIVLDENAEPTDYLKELISLFELEAGPDGFAQGDNVHRLGVVTNRAGILVAGPARNALDRQACQTDADALALRSAIPAEPSGSKTKTWAEIDAGACIRCLTCRRMCPHAAIEVDARVRVLPEACEACGICAAECPREAIHLPGADDFAAGESLLGNTTLPAARKEFSPTMMAFCCSRSAIPAGRLAVRICPAMPAGLRIVEVPCAGSLSLDHVLSGFQKGVDGVLVLTCHADNCHAGHGNQRAWERVATMRTRFAAVGLEKERLQIGTLASNMGAAFAATVTEFGKTLREMGPSRLK